MRTNYKFSIILSVYNDEKYLEESIESIINQNIGFKDNVQFIIVNDGSTDESKNIIRKYVSKFPDNIVALSQENKGLAYARNLALDFVEGQYVNFFDADDYLCEDVLSTVYDFFESNPDFNIASIPIKFFEKSDEVYELNYKCDNLELIDLSSSPNNPLLSLSSCFIKKDLIDNNKFSTNLIFSEDSLFLNKLLIKYNKYAFIPSVILYQRLRNDLSNRSQQVIFNKKYYTERLRNFHIDLINYSLLDNPNVPKFTQYTILYELLSLIKKQELDVFDEESEKEEFFDVLTEIFSYIDDDVINNNCYVDNLLLKSFLFYLKNRDITYELEEFNVKLKFGDYIADNLNKHRFWIDEVKFKKGYLHITGFFNSLFDIKDISIVAVKEKNGKYNFYSGAYFNHSNRHSTKFLSKTLEYSHSFSLNIPTRDLEDSNFRLRVDYHKNGDKFDNRRENLIFSYLGIFFTYHSEFDKELLVNSGDFSLSLEDKYFYVKKGFKFSVVMAIYNTEDYVEQAINSVINQTIGFEENIQLILVNDGSTDGTENILLNYKKQYPNNIILINQENQGQASARNNGLNYVNGKYVNFLDSDDYLSENVVEEVYDFFEEHESETDVVSVPLVMFGRSSEKHALDYKFNEPRVIDLTKEPNHPQLHVSSSFIKFDSVKDNKFPTTITGSEDGNFVNNILLYKEKLGVINKGVYFYRKREDETSTLDTMSLRENFYIPRLKDHFMNLINQSLDMYGKVPRFIQYTIVYDLQWLLSISELEVYTEKSDINEFWHYIDVILSYIDLSVITNNININSGLVRNFLIYLKKKNLHFEVKNDEILLKTDNYLLDRLNIHNIWLDIVEIKNGFLNISGFMNSLFDSKFLSIAALKTNCDGSQTKYYGEYVEYSLRKGIKFLDKQWQYSFTFDLKVPLTENESSKINVLLNFHYDGDNTNLINSNIIPLDLDLKFLPHVRISAKSNFIVKDNHILYFEENEFNIIPYSYKSLIKLEKNVRNIINDEKPYKYISILRLRLTYLLLYPFIKNKKIYLFMDRIESADDNAEHLFKYAVSRKDDVKKYFVLSKDSGDYPRLSKIGKVVKFNSFKHRLLYVLAEKVISSHPDESILSPFFSYEKNEDQREYINSLVTSETYFLQHGVTKDNISKWLKKYDKNLRLILTVSDDETNSFFDEGYNYDEDVVQALGFPRFDNLKNNPKNKILIIPTWRNYLEGNRGVFMNSDYFKSLNDLINDEKLISLCEKNNYEIIFKAHPKLNTQISDEDNEKYVDLFNFNEHIKVSTEESYQELFEVGSLLITDYSSVFFDFAYLKKPVIYYQPNDDYHHEKSYFKYETMGFGDVINNHEDIITKLEEYINNGCEMESVYKDNVENFFKYIDKNNCQRVYDWITKN